MFDQTTGKASVQQINKFATCCNSMQRIIENNRTLDHTDNNNTSSILLLELIFLTVAWD